MYFLIKAVTNLNREWNLSEFSCVSYSPQNLNVDRIILAIKGTSLYKLWPPAFLRINQHSYAIIDGDSETGKEILIQ